MPSNTNTVAVVEDTSFVVVAVAKSDEDVVAVDNLFLQVHHLRVRVVGGGVSLEVNVKGRGGGLEILRVIVVNNAPNGRGASGAWSGGEKSHEGGGEEELHVECFAFRLCQAKIMADKAKIKQEVFQRSRLAL